MPTPSIHSVTSACKLLSCLPDRLRQAVQQSGIEPVMQINGLVHYDETDLERVRQVLTVSKAPPPPLVPPPGAARGGASPRSRNLYVRGTQNLGK